MLAATSVAGDPGSPFHRETAEGWADALGLTPATDRQALLKAIFTAVLPQGRGQTDLFGMRLQAHSRDRFTAALAELHPDLATDTARIKRAFGRTAFLYLKRDDTLARAVSYLIAQQSGLWHRAADGSELERTAPSKPPTYDAAQITAQIAEFDAQNAAWEAWFTANAIAPHRISYDGLSADPQATLADVLTALDLDPVLARTVSPGTKKLADATSADWIDRYRAEQLSSPTA